MGKPARNTEEMRRHRRQTIRILVDYHTPDGVRCDYATTLGAGGMFLATSDSLKRGDTMKLRFKLPGYETLHVLEGRVVWVRAGDGPGANVVTPGAGIQFVDSVDTARLARELEDYEI